MNIITLGPDGSYSSIASKRVQRENPGTTIIYSASIPEIFAQRKGSDLAIIPIENNYGGPVHDTMYAIYQQRGCVQILGWISLRIEHCLAGISGSSVESIENIYSHPQALRQCEKNIAKLGATPNNVASTTAHIPYLKRGEAVICSKDAAIASGLAVLDSDFAPENNITKFAIFGSNEVDYSANKLNGEKFPKKQTIAILSVGDAPGALARSLTAIANAGLSLHFIESIANTTGGYDFPILIENPGGLDIKDIVKDFDFGVQVI